MFFTEDVRAETVRRMNQVLVSRPVHVDPIPPAYLACTGALFPMMRRKAGLMAALLLLLSPAAP